MSPIAAMRLAATVSLTPVMVISRFTAPSSSAPSAISRSRLARSPSAQEISRRIAITADPELPVSPTCYGGIDRIVDMLARVLTSRGRKVTLPA
jgi:hypothetical protein